MPSMLDELLSNIAKDISYGERENGAADLLNLAKKRQEHAISATAYDAALQDATQRYQENNTSYLNKLDASLAEMDKFSGEESKQRRDAAQQRYQSLLNAHVNQTLVDAAVAQGWVPSGAAPRDEQANVYGANADLRKELNSTELAAYEAGYTPLKAQAVNPVANTMQALREADAYDMANTNVTRANSRASVAKNADFSGTKAAPSEQVVGRTAPVQQRPKTREELINETYKYEGDRYEAKRKLIDNHRSTLYGKAAARASAMFGAGTDGYKAQMDVYKNEIDNAFPVNKPIIETEMFKAAQQEGMRAGYQQNMYTLGFLHNELKAADELLKQGKEMEARNLINSNIPKILQSLGTGQSDAIQDSEAKRLLIEFSTYWNSSPVQWLNIMAQKGPLGGFKMDLKSFMDKAKTIYKAGAAKMNADYEHSRNQLGEAINQTPFKRLNDEVSPSSKQMSIGSIRDAFLERHKVDPLEFNPYSDQIKEQQSYGQKTAPAQLQPSQLRSGRIINAGKMPTLNVTPNMDDIKEQF